jgi:hypothetical protein
LIKQFIYLFAAYKFAHNKCNNSSFKKIHRVLFLQQATTTIPMNLLI